MKHFWIAACAASLWAQTGSLTCDATADPVLVRQEGVSELTGIINIRCAAVSPGIVSGGIIVYPSATVTNPLTAAETIDARLTVETATGTQVIGGNPLLIGSNGIVFGNFQFTMPASGETTFRITNIRVSAPSGGRTITAFISTNGVSSIGIRNNPVAIGVVDRGLLAASSNARIVCRGSPVPESLLFGDFLAGSTTYFSFRVTENSPGVYQTRQAGTTNGQRILVRYSGFPRDARVFVPQVIVGSSGLAPTSVGEFGVPAAGGTYRTGSSSLLLAFVRNADSDGGGGTLVPTADANGTFTFSAMAEVILANGSGVAVFEVADTNAYATEFALIPVFVTLPANSASIGSVASATVSFGPLSRDPAATRSAPVPRYLDLQATPDCRALNDCNASYFPRLAVGAQELTFNYEQGTRTFASHYITVKNESGGLMRWVASVTYAGASPSDRGWLKVDPPDGVNNASIILSLTPPDGMAAGAYEARLKIEAGQAGSVTYPVRLTVLAGKPPGPPPPDPKTPRYWLVGNSANLALPTLVPGSLGTIEGVNLSGSAVAVLLDSTAAEILSNTDSRIVFVVPPTLSGRAEAELVVAANNLLSERTKVPFAAAAPAIFTGGVLNSDGTPNSESNPETVGNNLQIFATGLPLSPPHSLGARIHDRDITQPAYAGLAPGQAGVQQVNIWIPDDLPTMPTEVRACGWVGGDRTCSLGHPVWIAR